MLKEIIHYATFDTASPVGMLTFAVSERGLAVLSFGGRESLGRYQRSPLFKNAEWKESRELPQRYFEKVRGYLRGEDRDLQMQLDLRGTPFQRKCWDALLTIPFGETRSYAQMAAAVECPLGFRAVGMANNKNPIAIVVPCHRVIESNGKLGGYGGGLPAKEWLLKLEGAPVRALAAKLF